MRSFRLIAALAAFAAFATTLPLSIALRAETIGKVSQPIIVGDEVSTKRQRQLGLVIVGGGCSGTLINRYWVLTASHCVSTDGTEGGPDAPFKDSRITANWTGKIATPTRYVRYWGSNGLDVALVFLGAGDLGHVDRKLIYHNEVDPSMTMTKFGQGFCVYATPGPPARPAQSNCGYRSARLAPHAASQIEIEFRPNANGQIGSFGDSGGPDYVTDGYGNLLSIAGITVAGRNTYLPGKPEAQMWVNGETAGYSAALLTIRDDIHRHMSEGPSIIVAAPPKDYSEDLMVSRDTGMRTKMPSSYDDLRATETSGANTGMRTKGPSSYKDLMATGPSGASTGPVVPAEPSLPYGPATCRSGFVWRVAAASDLVCVTPEARDRVAEENASAALRWRGSDEGDRRCKRAYVYREAYPGDDVCVTPESYDLAAEENAEGPSRRVQP